MCLRIISTIDDNPFQLISIVGLTFSECSWNQIAVYQDLSSLFNQTPTISVSN